MKAFGSHHAGWQEMGKEEVGRLLIPIVLLQGHPTSKCFFSCRPL